MLTLVDVAMSYGPKLLFTDVNLNLRSGYKYGLVGSNGAGKSTFFKLLIQDQEPAFGEINIPRNSRIGCLKQDQFLYEDVSIINTVIAGKKALWTALQEKEELLKLADLDEESGYKLGELESVIMDNDGYTAETFAAELLVGLGLKEEYHHQPLSVLSGGYKLRVLLAQSLFNNPDILLLDEPTNHLDIISIYWLEEYLKQKFKGVLVIISHDVAFLNNVTTHILDIDYGEIKQYTGNYNNFAEQKQQIVEQKLHEINYLEKRISHMQSIIDKFRAGTRARQAQSKQKQVDRIELPDIQKSSRISPKFHFKQRRSSGKLVLKVDDISKSYKEKNILNNINFDISRGEKVVIIGPNGVGKSTLLKILLDHVKADRGVYEWGYETHISYFAQDHHEQLHKDINVFEWLYSQFPQATHHSIRTVLGNVLFGQDDISKSVLHLSGGEAARLLLAKIMLDESNILVFDEPTNHLDIESKETLKKSLVEYDGTLLLVTHDRDFASHIANRVIAIADKSIIDFRGKYNDYIDKYGKDYLCNAWTLQQGGSSSKKR